MNILNFKNGISPMMEEFLIFHDKVFMVLMIMMMLVLMIFFTIYKKNYSKNIFLDNNVIEFFWTLLPGIILFILALPSLKLLYYLDISEFVNPSFTMKSCGNQWYWMKNFFYKKEEFSYPMYMVTTKDLQMGDFRSLETDSVLMVPVKKMIRLLLTSDDVIHSFTMPQLGLKLDAVPGRINQQYFSSKIVGIFYGQCSEICGANHSFMPITMEIYLKYSNGY